MIPPDSALGTANRWLRVERRAATERTSGFRILRVFYPSRNMVLSLHSVKYKQFSEEFRLKQKYPEFLAVAGSEFGSQRLRPLVRPQSFPLHE